MNVQGLRELTSPFDAYTLEGSIHLHGDSFANLSLRASIAARFVYGRPRVFTGFTVNGGTMADQAANLEENPIWWNRILVMMDGGLTDSYATAVASIESMIGLLTPYGKWLYVQGGLNSERATGETLRTTFDQVNAYVVTNYPDNYVPTKLVAQGLAISDAEASGYANDQTDLASDIWPRSLTSDGLHPTAESSPNTGLGQSVSGAGMLADQIAAKINANGW